MPKTSRITVQFNTEDSSQLQALEFLDRCGYRKNKMIAVMVSEFIEKYGLVLDRLNPEEIKKFLSGYEYIRQNHDVKAILCDSVYKKDEMTIHEEKAVQTGESKPDTRKGIHHEAQKSMTTIDMDKADRALSAFGL